ncbi:MAG: hypothetical protein QM766_13080 [Burkholderiaceae bacterium]
MIGRIKRSTRLAASYVNVFTDLLAVEARQEVQRLIDRCRQKLIAAVLLLFGFLWLNIGVFVLIWDSPYRHWMPFAIGVGVVLVALLVWQVGRGAGDEPAFAAARKALAEDAALWNIDLTPGHVLGEQRPASGAEGAAGSAAAAFSRESAGSQPDAPAPSVDELERQLRELRVALKRTVSGADRSSAAGSARSADAGRKADGSGGESGGAAPHGFSEGFQPKSRTMRTVMTVVTDVIGDGRSGGGLGPWPARIVAVVLASRLVKRNGRWLIAAWPVIRLVVAQLARSRRSADRADRADRAARFAERADVGARGPGSTQYDPARPSDRSADARQTPFQGSSVAPGSHPPPPR